MYVDFGNDEDDFGGEEIMEGRDMGVRIEGKVLICGDEVGKKDVHARTDQTWLRGGGEESGRANKDRRGGGDGTPIEGAVGAVDGSAFFVECDGFALRGCAVVCFEQEAGMSVDACVLERSPPKRRLSSIIWLRR